MPAPLPFLRGLFEGRAVPPRLSRLPRARKGKGAALIAACLLGLLSSPVLAVQPDEMLRDPALEARARALSAELRCLVCQNQSIDDSDAPLARDLRLIVRERIMAGDSDRAVKEYLVARYGEFVLLRPVFDWRTALLWGTPLLVLLLGGAIAAASLRARAAARPDEAPALTDEEKERLARLGGE